MRERYSGRERSAGRRRGGGVACEAATPETAGAERAEGDSRPMGRDQGQRPELDGASPRGGACGTWRAPCRTAEGAGPVRGGEGPRPRYQTRAGIPRGAKAGCRPGRHWRGQGCRRIFGRRHLPAGSGKAEPWERSDQGAATQGRTTATPPAGGRGGNGIFRSWPACRWLLRCRRTCQGWARGPDKTGGAGAEVLAEPGGARCWRAAWRPGAVADTARGGGPGGADCRQAEGGGAERSVAPGLPRSRTTVPKV